MENLRAKTHNLKLQNVNDAMDIIGSGLPGCIFTQEDIDPNFFDLKNRIAGEVFQKLTTYNFPIAIVLPDDHGLGERITELIRDHKNHNCVRFFTSIEQAESWLKTIII